MAEPKTVLIVGETPERVDFSDPAIPKGMTAQKIRSGLDKAMADLQASGHTARLVLVDDEPGTGGPLGAVLRGETFDVIVVGAGLRIVPRQTRLFETVMNVVHTLAPHARLAFNVAPEDSAAAAERQLAG